RARYPSARSRRSRCWSRRASRRRGRRGSRAGCRRRPGGRRDGCATPRGAGCHRRRARRARGAARRTRPRGSAARAATGICAWGQYPLAPGAAEGQPCSPMSSLVFHLIAQTHWDREWYLPRAALHARLVPALDDLVTRLTADPAYRSFLLDGQTILLEDYVRARTDREADVQASAKTNR